MSLIDGDNRRVDKVLRGFQHPRYVAVHPRLEFAYVTDSAAGEVAVIDLRRRAVVRRVDVGGAARHVSISARGTRLWTALGSTASHLAVLDTSTPDHPRLLRRCDLLFLAHDVVIASNYGSVWVTSGDRGRIAIYRLNGAKLIGQIAAAASPQHVAFVAGRAFVASGDDGSVRVHDAASGRLQRTTTVPAGSFNVTAGGGRIATPSLERGSIVILDRAGRVLHERHVAVFLAPRLLDLAGVGSGNTAGSRATSRQYTRWMDDGTSIFLTDETIGPAHLARLVEERGFRSLFVPGAHPYPLSRCRRPGLNADEKLPRHYYRCLDPSWR